MFKLKNMLCKNNYKKIDIEDYYIKDIIPNLTPGMVKVLREYTGDFYEIFLIKILNEIKKENELSGSVDDIISLASKTSLSNFKITSDELDLFDKAISLGSLPCDLVLYRGTNKKYINATTKMLDFDSIQNLTYLSASLKEDIANIFLTDVIMEFHLPQGFPAFYLKPFSLHRREEEFIIMRNQKFKILEKKRIAKYIDYHTIHEYDHLILTTIE